MASVDCTDILKALSDRTRQRLVKALLAKDHGVNELTELLEMSQYNISKHLRILKEAGIVGMRPLGQRREYYISRMFRRRLTKKNATLDFGCCTFDMDRLA